MVWYGTTVVVDAVVGFQRRGGGEVFLPISWPLGAFTAEISAWHRRNILSPTSLELLAAMTRRPTAQRAAPPAFDHVFFLVWLPHHRASNGMVVWWYHTPYGVAIPTTSTHCTTKIATAHKACRD
jgi:hypothetical protein